MKSNQILIVLFCLIVIALLPHTSVGEETPLIVHEWGTFTVLQNEKGDAIPGINIDDERLPGFCHNLLPWINVRPFSFGFQMKGAPPKHPYVNMRLETPVIYFHPAKGAAPFEIDVDVQFRGGWLTEFFPQAIPSVPGLDEHNFTFGPIKPDTISSLLWKKVKVGTPAAGPKTDAHVWTAPRQVDAADVTVGPQRTEDAKTESDRFLFYRGVANRKAPLRVKHELNTSKLQIESQCAEVFSKDQSATINAIWLMHTRSDGTTAYRELGSAILNGSAPAELLNTSSHFDPDEYAQTNMPKLKAKMHSHLMKAGLFEDEATAMLSTWENAYFKSPGLRLFFMVPEQWTNSVLPIRFSKSVTIKRVMMGRVEIITDEQRDLLKKLATVEVSPPTWIQTLPASQARDLFLAGRSDFGDLGVPIPADYQIYLKMGRFRNALILAESKKSGASKNIANFIQSYNLEEFDADKVE